MQMEGLVLYLDHNIRFKTSRAKPKSQIKKKRYVRLYMFDDYPIEELEEED